MAWNTPKVAEIAVGLELTATHAPKRKHPLIETDYSGSIENPGHKSRGFFLTGF